MRLPLRALPLAIKATHLAANACAYAWAALADLHADLVALHEPVSVDDLREPWTAESINAGMDVIAPSDKGRVN